ncbi:MAG: hypothetical protein KAY65_00960 [Planctomycetes bacterium]|nr:hypothetical protein [Planctomycetota bacterium]
MRYLVQWLREPRFAGYRRIATLMIAVVAAGYLISTARADEFKPNLYVPYQDLVHLIEPADKAVLMDRAEFEKLLAAAEQNEREADTLELGQVKRAEYTGKVSGEELTLTGKLEVVSIGKGPVAVPLGFAGIGLSRVILDGTPAPLGYDKKGRLTLIVQAKGTHQLEIAGTTKVNELASGGTQFSISLPQAVAGRVKLAAAGDLEIHATVPASATSYDKQADLTSVELTIGGKDKLTVVMLGNGRQEDDRVILLGESAATVNLTRSHQVLSCLYTVQVLRRGVRQLQFELPQAWTVTEVTSPSLVRWSVDAAEEPKGLKKLSVRLRSGKVGTTALHIKATAVRTGQSWDAPRILLVDAAFQRGYLMVNTDEALGVRGQKVVGARREDALSAVSVPGLVSGSTGPLYFHWGDNWSVNLELVDVELRRSIKEQQKLVVSPQQVTLTGDFEVTAVERELFELSFVLRGSARQWQVKTVLVDKKQTGFEYRIEEQPDRRLLKIELPRPIQPEKTANVTIVTQHVPSDWRWPSDAAQRSITVPLIQSQGETVSGHVSLWAEGDLDVEPNKVPDQLEPVPVGRMASLGMAGNVQHAYSHNAAVEGNIELLVSRRRPRKSADAVALITVRPREFSADWRITYAISRASAKRLYLLADKSLGQEFKIASTTVPINSKSIVQPDEKTIPLSEELAQRYNLWLLNLDHSSLGNVVIDIHYERPVVDKSFDVPLVRPVCGGEISEQLAVQASEELALKIKADGAKEIDAVDLPPLPAQAARILWAFRLDAATTPTGSATALMLETDVHESYEIPSALAVSVRLTTYLDVKGGQRTEAAFRVANAGRQFLTIRLPDGAELWSLSVSGRPVKPQRSAGGDYQVTLGQLGKPVPVKVVYACREAQVDLERLDLGGIELPGVEINQMSWTVVPPPGYRITTQQTKMQTHDLRQPAPAYLQLYRYLHENVFPGLLFVPVFTEARLGKKVDFAGGGAVSYEYDLGEDIRTKAEMPAEKEEAKTAEPMESYLRRRSAKREVAKPPVLGDLGVRLVARGRFTLPVDLVPTAGAGRRAMFAGLGTGELTIGLTRTAWMSSCWAVGLVLIAAIGIALVRQPGKTKAILIIAVLAVASLLALWRPEMTYFANGAFTAGVCLIPLYVLVALIRWLCSRLHPAGTVSPVSAVVAVLLVSILCFGCSAQAAEPAQLARTETAPAKNQQPVAQPQAKPMAQLADSASEPLIIPYDGDPTAAEDSNKVLIPYTRFVKLWNQAHPEDTIDGPRPGTDVSLAAVQYSVTVEAERLNVVLTADIKTYGRDWVVLPMPISGLAVTEATIDGKPARLHSLPQTQSKQAGAKGMVLMLPGRTSGRLQLKAVAKPKYFGRRGSVKFSLPPLPGAVMDVVLPQEDLELEVDQIESAPSRQKTNGTTKWTVPLGMTRDLTLRWLPKAGGGAADRTLSAASAHDVYAFHWAIVGVSKITYSFSGGEHDRFTLLAPKGAALTEVKGANIRDYRNLGERTVEGKSFNLVEVRLHRPAEKQYVLTVRWLGELPASDKSVQLLLVRAADVTRESGTVTLHSAGSMTVKVARIAGGRRTAIGTAGNSRGTGLTADRASPVARYYWPYRPFALFVQLSRAVISPKVHLDQLVRVNTDRTELLVQAKLATEQGKLFGASFILPAGYELLSAVGPAVDNFYERSSDNRRFLHVKFHRGRQETTVALVLVRRDAPLEAFDVPLITYIDSAGPAPDQQGRVAVQVAASLEAKTIAGINLKAVVPGTLRDWLDSAQINSVQFAYRYEAPNPSLQLDIRPQPTRVRVETFVGLAVKPTAAVYTYRLRYNISGSPVDNLSFSLPNEYAPLVAVNSPALRTVTKSDSGAGRTTWKVALVNEVTGEVDIAVNFALPIDASTKLLRVPRLKTDAPAGYRAIIAVQNMSRHDISVKDKTKLADLAVSEQRKLMMSRRMTESLQYVFESFEDDWSLSLDFAPAKTAARIRAVVDLLALTTVIDRNGRCRYQARLALQNRSEQFLQVEVPQGLRLWSATVAFQPVKPVTTAASARGQILIPLVKTSPGGLPYDVYLYFADEQAGPLLEPLNGITKLRPPGISIVGIPVMRTTWSLRLPAGYRYMRPGGNMSPVAGTVEVLSLNIEAKLDQLKRLDKTYREVSVSAGRGQTIARRNWDVFNEKLNTDIEQAQSFLEANRRRVSDEDYERLSSQLRGQGLKQVTLITGNTAYIQEQQEQTRNDLNFFINATATNPGLAEVARNNALQQKPGFISEGEKRQIARLTKELEVSQKQLKVLRQEFTDFERSAEGVVVDADAVMVDTQHLIKGLGKGAKDLIVAGFDKNADVSEILNKLSEQSATQIDRKQAQLRHQLEELADNRLRRHFQAPEQMGQARQPQAKAKAPATIQPSSGITSQDQYTMEARGRASSSRHGGVVMHGGRDEAGARGSRALGVTAGGESKPAEPQVYYDAVAGPGAKPSTAAEGIQPYVAKGTYSLPVTLPEGEVRLDFARPAGQAQLSIWAVPLTTIHNLYATATIVVALLVALGIVKVWPNNRPSISVKRAIVYFLVFLVLTVAAGLLGLIISLAIIFAAETLRAASLRRKIAPAPN